MSKGRAENLTGTSIAAEFPTITADQCRANSEECHRLGMLPNISKRRATILASMATTWASLANQTDLYDMIVKEESQESAVNVATSKSDGTPILQVLQEAAKQFR